MLCKSPLRARNIAWVRGLLVLALSFLIPAQAPAQEVSAGITGLVLDASGAAIVGAEVTAKDVDRGTEWSTTTNEQGIYFFPRIPAGNYELTFGMEGFRTLIRPNVMLEVNQRARVDVSLEVGAVTESIEVVGVAPVLQTDTTIVASTLSSNTVVNAPLVSRNFIELTLLSPGVTTTNPSGFKNSRRTTGGGRPYVNGNRKEANNFLLDGIDNNQVSDNLTSYQPNLDAIGEVKMITNNAPAEFGNFQGGIVSVHIKSGTNDFHGSVFHFFRNDKLNANNWARNWQGNDRPALRWNTFGGAIGGPIVRDKLFFFGDYQGLRQANPGAPSSISVIPAEFRQGDFSRLLTEQNRQLYDPNSQSPNGIRQPFPNNQVPLSMFSPVAVNLFNRSDLYPLPLNGDLRFNQLNVGSSYIYTDQGDGKIDWKASANDDIAFRYSTGRQDIPGRSTFPLFFNSFNESPFHAGVFNWTRTFSPTVVNEARFGVNRITLHNGGEDNGLGNLAEELGIVNGNERGPGLMSIQFTGGFANNIGSTSIGTHQLFANTTYHLADNLSVIKGRHMIKMGGQILRQHMNTFYAGNNGRTGFIRFTNIFTAGPDARSPLGNSGFPEADFVLGLPTRLGRGVNTGTWGHRKWIYGLYIQDDWRATDSLTLNLGIRWEYHTPLVEVADRQSNFHPFTGELQLAGEGGNSRALYEPYRKDFQPRVGFAWTPGFLDGKTVFRGAYTISSFMEGTGTNLRLPLNPPFNQEFETIYESDLFPGSTLREGLSNLQGLDPFRGINVRLWDPHVRPANTQQWSFFLEREMMPATVWSVGYVGQHGTHLVVPMPYFQRRLLPDGTAQPSPYLSGNPLLANIAQISGTESNGNQQYHGLQTTLRRRMEKGLEYQIAYTYSKGMSDAIGYYGEGGQSASQSAYWQYLYDQRAEWGPTYFDAAHMFTLVTVYDLPFGRGKALGSNWNPVVNGILGSWQLGSILTLRSGFPLTVQALDRSGTISRGPRANRVGDGKGPQQVGRGTTWLDRSAFTQPVSGTLGNSGVGVVRGPDLRNFDLSVQKYFPVGEGKRFEFRAEFFNLTNTPAFSSPNRAVQSPNFGEITGSQGERNVQFALKYVF